MMLRRISFCSSFYCVPLQLPEGRLAVGMLPVMNGVVVVIIFMNIRALCVIAHVAHAKM